MSAQRFSLRSSAPTACARRDGGGRVARGNAASSAVSATRVPSPRVVATRREQRRLRRRVDATNAARASSSAAASASDEFEVPRGDTAGAMMTLHDVRVTVGDRDLLAAANLRVVGVGDKRERAFFLNGYDGTMYKKRCLNIECIPSV